MHYKEFLSDMIDTLNKNVSPFRFPFVVINQDQFQVSLMNYAMKMPIVCCTTGQNAYERYLLALPNNIQLRSHTTKYSGHLGVTLKSGPQ